MNISDLDSHAKAAEESAKSGKKPFVPTKFSLLTILMASLLMLMGGAAVAPALPQMTAAFPQYSETMVNLVITLPSLAIAIFGFAVGMAADRFGKVKVLCLSLLIFALAGFSGYFLNDLLLILVFRFILGIGIAGITCCCTALISEYYYGAMRVKALGYQSAAIGLGVLVLESSGGVLAEYGWHEPFLIYEIGFLILALALISLREPTPRTFNLTGTAVTKPSRPANQKLVVFGYVTIFVMTLTMFVIPTKLTGYMNEYLNLTSSVAGVMLGFNGVFNAVACLLYRRISLSLSQSQIMFSGFLLMTAGFFLFLAPASLLQVMISSVIIGFGVGMITTGVIHLISENVSGQNSGRLMGGYAVFLNLGQFASTFLLAALLSTVGELKNLFPAVGVIDLLFAAVFLVLWKVAHRGPAVSAQTGL